MRTALNARQATSDTTAPTADRERWALVERILASRHFSKAATLSNFLRYICERSLAGCADQITEQRIGVRVFGRSPGYNPAEDNIVRNYARQLRRRLADYFAAEGRNERLVLMVPRGGYVPLFVAAAEVATGSAVPIENESHGTGSLWNRSSAVALVTEPEPGVGDGRETLPAADAEVRSVADQTLRPSRRMFIGIACALVLLLAVSAGVWQTRRTAQPSPRHRLWAVLFSARMETFVVPADSSFGVLQNLAGRRIPLADYVEGRYGDLELPSLNPHAAHDLQVQQYTSMVDLQIASSIVRLPEVIPDRLVLRFARELHMDDLKNSNAVIIGSPYSNPWAEVFQSQLNFRFVYRPDLHRSWIENIHPEPGERTHYENGWDEPAHQTYATLSLVSNLRGNGHVLLIQGLDVAGTQAAAELAFKDAALRSILDSARRADGSLRSFEVLLETSSIGSNAPSARVLKIRCFDQ